MTLPAMNNVFLRMAIWLQRPFFMGKSLKVNFPIIEPDGTKIGTEGIWCNRLGYHIFEVDNIPFAVRNLSIHDIVECGWSKTGWRFLRKRRWGGLGCARIYSEKHNLSDMWNNITQDLIVKYEFASESRLAVAAPPATLELIAERIHTIPDIRIEITA